MLMFFKSIYIMKGQIATILLILIDIVPEIDIMRKVILAYRYLFAHIQKRFY